MVGQVRGGGGVNRLQPTGPFEENPKVGRTLAELAKRAQEGGASSIMFLPAKGVKYDAYAFAYHTGLNKEMNITAQPKGPLRGTLVINISGHAQGALVDRVTGFAERQLAREGWRVDGDVKKFSALRSASEKAMGELARDPQKAEADIDIGDGKALKLTRAMFDKMQRASPGSDDAELARLAEHGNDALRKQFAGTNTYNVRIRLPDGTINEMRGLPRNNPDRIEFSTRIAIELPEGTTGEVMLEAWPTGSAEVAGYVEARRYKIHVGDGFFDLEKAVAGAEAYQAAHPEVRWDTDHEDEDLERTHVAPSPYPYQDF